ncbi:UPF0538 protein C2orf76 like [Schistosoma japonicum]|nr:UPF0538 protein C2orf76 like [Schistosoma japonicum]
MSQSITVPVTLIRSFKYRTTFYLPLSDISQSTTVKELFNRIQHELETSSVIPPPFKNHCYDALKIRHKAFKTKSGDLLVDIEGDPTSSNSEETLESLGIGTYIENIKYIVLIHICLYYVEKSKNLSSVECGFASFGGLFADVNSVGHRKLK